MRVKFKQAVYLCGREYSVGTHEVPGEVLKHKFFHRLIKAGMVEDGEATPVAQPTSIVDRQKKLAERLGVVPKASGEKTPETGPNAEPEVPGAPAVAIAADVQPETSGENPQPPAGLATQIENSENAETVKETGTDAKGSKPSSKQKTSKR